ncbi:UDP-4-amino-4,6-dideoxy-N-acetyl-beta-L-altrosamine transaminase [Porphyromonas gingivalis]|uniref:UDP-4-amino-4, 6-dideoxy-N-acetyl-beta-L-altrosamine transaminase n=1 Tax=Porphyromonas gingivalis TaxID=837 RepID=A0AAF0BB02_PORGN|nr:UDP-4-amino-4,6-dideoxy-N-acetyl-beta-L-altrosamine transaminase [Porphyromonas gingivalis]WCF98146.1 UDP-4-amino-4,6-dideoxy-N-acetyl-beta-L-altrosamine transaminase [Porphyromonas gingivalis]
MKYIPYGRPLIEEDDMEAVIEVLKSDFISTGPKVTEFERLFADYVGAKYAVAVSSGTAALHCAYLAIDLLSEDEVITTPMSFIATSNAAIYCGARIKFADIQGDSLNVDTEYINKLITSSTKVIVPVHFAGRPCEMDKILEIAKQHNLYVIEDASHALGASYKGKKIGSIGDMTTFSFHPVKHITTGEGGMITTNDENIYHNLLKIRNHGIVKSHVPTNKGEWYYEQQLLGYNYRLTDIQCALGISQLKKLDRWIKKRRELANYYNERLQLIEELEVPTMNKEHAWHLYIIKVKDPRHREKLFTFLRGKSIGVNVHYIPIHMQPYYQSIGYKKNTLPVAESVYEHIITLPLHPSMTLSEADYIINSIEDYFNTF